MKDIDQIFESDEVKINKLENDKIIAEESLRNMTNNVRGNLRALDNEINRLEQKINKDNSLNNIDNTPKRVTSNQNLGGKKWQ